MTKLFLALHNTPLANDRTFGQWDWNVQPLNILCSFALKGALKSWKNRLYETLGVQTILDSGAYSAWKTGTPTEIEDLMVEAEGNEWDEVASLDVIGSANGSRANALLMKENVDKPILPVFHYGEPWEFLVEYKEKFNNRVALGGITSIGMPQKMKWLGQCFARAYPCKFHGFGIGTKEVMMAFPFISCDTASWGAVHMYGRSQAVPGLKIPKLGDGNRDDHYDLRYEVSHYCEMEKEVQQRWAQELLWAQPALKPNGLLP